MNNFASFFLLSLSIMACDISHSAQGGTLSNGSVPVCAVDYVADEEAVSCKTAPFTPIHQSKGLANLPDFSGLKHQEHLAGGAGGVHVFRDSMGKKWTLKAWSNTNHGANECIASELFQLLGLNTPQAALYHDLPEVLKSYYPEATLFRLAEFIEGTAPTRQEVSKLAPNAYVTLAFLSSWDSELRNLKLSSDGKLYFIDTGSALLHRALGAARQEKEHDWSAYQVSEFESFETTNFSTKQGFSRPETVDGFKEALFNITEKASLLLERTSQMAKSLHYARRPMILNMISSRLRHLQILGQYQSKKLNPKADPFALAGAYDAAGELTWTVLENDQGEKTPHILLGQRIRHKWWGNLGGKSDPNETLAQTATREVKEESGEKINRRTHYIRTKPSHDLLMFTEWGTFNRYRTYLAYHDYINPSTLKNEEYSQYTWVSVVDVLEALEENNPLIEEGQATLKVGDHILHPPFLASLRQPQIKIWLKNLRDRKPLEKTCTQGVYTSGRVV